MSGNQWYVHINGQTLGPLAHDAVSLMLQQNRLQFVDFVWASHLTKWHRIVDLDDFVTLIPPYPKAGIPRGESAPSVAPAPTPPMPASAAAVVAPPISAKPAPEPEPVKPAKPTKQDKPAKQWPKSRKARRVLAASGQATLQTHGVYKLLNVSEGGVFLASEQRLDIGTDVKFVLEFPGSDKPLDMSGVVIRHGELAGHAGFAVQFTRLNPAHKRILIDYVEAQPFEEEEG